VHLEKVTSRSSEAGLAGWIASNDVTLFTMVLIMVIAIFLHTKLNKGAREQLQLTEQNSVINATLASTSSELDSARDLLERTSETLNLTQQERDQLQQQLVDKLAALAEVNARLEAILAEKGQLETQRQSLLADKQSLTKERSALVGDRDSLTATNMTLRERLDALSTQLVEKVAALEQVEEQRDRLKKQADQLDSIVAALKQKLKEMNVDLVEARDQATSATAASETRVQELQAKVAAGDKQAEDYLARLKRAAALLESLQAEKKQLEGQLTEAERRRQAELLEESQNNRELIGLKGRLERVAIIFDASGSMRQVGAGGDDRWAEAQEIAANWLQHLNVEQCVLIVYSSSVRTFPADGTFADLRGAAGKAKREALLKQLQGVKPGGWTNTYEALRKAYEYNPDTILLFTDGAPSRAASGLYDDALAKQIYQLCRTNSAIPVNTIGLGNYFDEDMSTFLRTVASLTGGTFRGE
jgi:predicted nuclease with TOPRIM domain